AAQKNISLHPNLAYRIPPYVLGDGSRVRQILVNLIGNALKFTINGGVFVNAELVSPPGAAPAVIKITIKDTGIGIPQDLQSRLFEPFYQVSSGTTKTMTGTGLGLAIAKRFCTMMGGEIGIESETGKGAAFWFTMSLQLPSEQQIFKARLEDTKKTVAPAFGAKHILVAEDVETNQFVIKNLLETIGCTCDLASNGEIAGKMAQEKNYDAILMDCYMPIVDGYEAAARIRKEGQSTVPIIALTAIAMKEDRDRCLTCGMNDFLAKPIEKNDLIRMFNKWLNT
ncbi:MAG: ATP-binding protein, partial [Alphaproteobacteria bacterium]|nr:ATP-binding protein [Alphaproteobacteria bacterium]